jgi:hypothetical protein
MTREEIISELNVLTSDYRFIEVIASINLIEFCSPTSEFSKIHPFDKLNFNEYKFIIGLWLKNHLNDSSNDEEYALDKAFQRVYDLLEFLHESYITNTNFFSEDKIPSFSLFMNDGDKFKETFFYGGAGAYDDQYIRLAVDKYILDEDWIRNNKNFSIKSVISFFDNIRNKVTDNLNNVYLKKSLSPYRGPIKLFCLSYEDITDGNEEFEHILQNFSTYYGSDIISHLDDIADYNAFSEKPIIKLKDEKYFIALPFSIADAIYETPFYWMTKDSSYKNTSLSNRGKAGETITYETLIKIFGNENVYKSVDIQKTKSSTATDIDVLVTYKDIGIIFQVNQRNLLLFPKKAI